MLAAFLALTLAAPRALPSASMSIYIPRLDRLESTLGFFTAAGEKAVLLRPDSWRRELHPLIPLDLARPESLKEAGVDPAGSATLSSSGDTRLTCITLSDPKKFEARATERLAEFAPPTKETFEGVSGKQTVSPGGSRGGYLIKGNESCSAAGPDTVAVLKQAAKLLKAPSTGAQWKQIASLPGSVFVATKMGVFGLKGAGKTLTAEGRAASLPLPALKKTDTSPYSTVPALALIRAQVAPTSASAVLKSIESQLLAVCADCDVADIRLAVNVLAPELTGNVMALADSIKIGGSLASMTARYFAVRHAYLAEVRTPAIVAAALKQAESWKGAKPIEGGISLKLPGGEIQIGLKGSHLFFANDAKAAARALALISDKPVPLAHGAEMLVDPKLLARGLGQVSLLDVLASNDLAAVFGLATELGPVLNSSERMSASIDSSGEGHTFAAQWQLAAEK